MPRNISCFYTQDQIRNRTKWVTRRLGWRTLKVGEILNACVKCQGLGKGGKMERICQIRVRDVTFERLDTMVNNASYGDKEATLEGFPEMTGEQFVTMFCLHMKCTRDTVVTRIEFEYLNEE